MIVHQTLSAVAEPAFPTAPTASDNCRYATKEATALASTHFQPVEGELIFEAGQTRRYISIPIIQSLIPEAKTGEKQ